MTLSEAARVLFVSEAYVLRLLAKGVLTAGTPSNSFDAQDHINLESVKARAYFTMATKGDKHEADCPYGGASFAHYGVTAAQPQAHKFDVDLPERLIPPRPPRRAGPVGAEKPSTRATPDEIRRRVSTLAAAVTIRNEYTTSLLKTLIDAREAAIAAIYKLSRIAALPSAERTPAMYAVLKAIPLALYGTTTNYSSAFHRTRKVPWKGSYIYFGTADVTVSAHGFILTSRDTIPNRNPSLPPIASHILVQFDKSNPPNRMERRITGSLAKAAGVVAGKAAHPVSWNAYGEFVINASTGD